MVSRVKVQNGIAMYLDRELMPHLNKGTVPGFITGVAAAFLIKRMDGIFVALSQNGIAKAFSVFDKEGNIDIDIVKDVLKEQMPEEGLYVDLSGLPVLNMMKSEHYSMTFHKSDVDKLYGYIMEASDY